jgi:hypothetical protein
VEARSDTDVQIVLYSRVKSRNSLQARITGQYSRLKLRQRIQAGNHGILFTTKNTSPHSSPPNAV